MYGCIPVYLFTYSPSSDCVYIIGGLYPLDNIINTYTTLRHYVEKYKYILRMVVFADSKGHGGCTPRGRRPRGEIQPEM